MFAYTVNMIRNQQYFKTEAFINIIMLYNIYRQKIRLYGGQDGKAMENRTKG